MQATSDDDRTVAKADRRLFFAAVFAHGGARLLSKVASAPLERVKVCLQVNAFHGGTQIPIGALGKIPHSLHNIFFNQGFAALWRGSATHISGIALGAVTRLGVLKTSQMWTMPGGDHQYSGLDSYARRCLFLYLAGCAALLVAYPLDVTYTCLSADMASPRRFRGVVHFVQVTRQEHGILSLYRGLPLCMATAAPFILVATAAHDVLAPRFLRQMGQAPPVDHRTEPGGGELFWLAKRGAPAHLYPWNLLVGAASGFLAQSVTYPLDTLRRNWQHSCSGTADAMPRSLRECAKQIKERGGWRAFYAGYGVNAAKLVPEFVVLCGVYLKVNSSGSFV
mmetsp:Transcript_143512/g.261136  ORF Transcript_143512/g.261136 Transcript_143512/m.261136 type:complete len:337 (+) Transcript_143512:112-1122(+)